MPKSNTNKNANDPRAAKSVRDIKRAMLELIAKEPFDKVRVEQILSTAPVNSNTFYKYFASKDDVLESIGTDLIEGMQKDLETLEPGNIQGG